MSRGKRSSWKLCCSSRSWANSRSHHRLGTLVVQIVSRNAPIRLSRIQLHTASRFPLMRPASVEAENRVNARFIISNSMSTAELCGFSSHKQSSLGTQSSRNKLLRWMFCVSWGKKLRVEVPDRRQSRIPFHHHPRHFITYRLKVRHSSYDFQSVSHPFPADWQSCKYRYRYCLDNLMKCNTSSSLPR